MNKIKLLHPVQAQKIAAGEVIERPSNVVKELIENSIDANATQITIYIENSGKNLIRIVDDGCGMSVEDAKLCFLPHATSKITNIDELEKINSFGFRGEALASISAISRVILITKINQASYESLGIKLEFADGKVQQLQHVSCNIGTDIQIHDLFYNVPVRKKFLKTDETEWNQIQMIFHSFCLSHINIHFKLFRDNKMILNVPAASSVKMRVAQVWGNNIAQNLLELKSQEVAENELNFTGYISNHNFWRYGRNLIFLFVNNRCVKNSELTKAIFKGYCNVLPPDKSPAAFIFTTIDKSLVDINCHPKKEEVRFIKPLTVQSKLQELVKTTLEGSITFKDNPDSSNFMQKVSNFKDLYEFNCLNSIILNANEVHHNLEAVGPCEDTTKSVPGLSNFAQVMDGQALAKSALPLHSTLTDTGHLTTSRILATVNKEIDESRINFKIIGQLFRTYILLENDGNLTIIDQHAAHERILYEKMLENFEHKDGVRLIFPEIVKLSDNQINLLLTQKDFLQKQGIEFEIISKNDISIKAGPVGLSQAYLTELILEIVSFVEENDYLDAEDFRKKLNEHTHSQLACKSAIKAGDELSFIQMQNLIQDLQKTKNRFICVHGRPTTWVIQKFDLEKNFKRR